jgi:hypothetical protein
MKRIKGSEVIESYRFNTDINIVCEIGKIT